MAPHYSQNKTDNLTKRERQALRQIIENRSIIINKADKGNTWMALLSSEEQEELLHKARLCAPEFKKLYRERRCKLQEERAQALQAKQLALLHLQEKAMKEKERLTNDLMLYGVWQSRSPRSQKVKLKSREAEGVENTTCFPQESS